MATNHGKRGGRGYNFHSKKGNMMARRLAEMKRDPDIARRMFGNPVRPRTEGDEQ